MAINVGIVKGIASALPPAVMIAILGFMGKGIVDNDRINEQQHIEIRKEVQQGDKEVHAHISQVKDRITDIRLEQMEQRGMMATQKALLEKIEKKL